MKLTTAQREALLTIKRYGALLCQPGSGGYEVAAKRVLEDGAPLRRYHPRTIDGLRTLGLVEASPKGVLWSAVLTGEGIAECEQIAGGAS